MIAYTKINTMFERNGLGLIVPSTWATPEIAYLADAQWYWTEKVNGTNIRVSVADISIDAGVGSRGAYLLPQDISYGGRTDDALISTHILRNLDERFRTEAGVQVIQGVFPAGGAILFGEGYGDKVNRQGGQSYKEGADFVLFDVLEQSGEGPLWLTRENVEDVADNLGLDVVPVVGQGTLYDAIDLVKGEYTSQWGDFAAEGVVAKPVVELQTRRGERIITKLKAQDFRRLEAHAAKEASAQAHKSAQ